MASRKKQSKKGKSKNPTRYIKGKDELVSDEKRKKANRTIKAYRSTRCG